ncbi:MAG: hypothetical protein AAB489_02180 [Patescibacteria group bacterium]
MNLRGIVHYGTKDGKRDLEADRSLEFPVEQNPQVKQWMDELRGKKAVGTLQYPVSLTVIDVVPEGNTTESSKEDAIAMHAANEQLRNLIGISMQVRDNLLWLYDIDRPERIAAETKMNSTGDTKIKAPPPKGKVMTMEQAGVKPKEAPKAASSRDAAADAIKKIRGPK